MNFIKKNTVLSSVKDIVEFNTHMSSDRFLEIQDEPYIKNLSEAADMIRLHNGPILCIGDYDADGICASTIIYIGLSTYGKRPKIRVPLRFSEGYGLSERIVEEADNWFTKQLDQIDNNALIITVDNGIAAHKAIAIAKQRGIKVIVTDHHLPVTNGGAVVYPEADIIVDPAAETESEFHEYCGATIAYRLIKELLPNTDLTELMVLASIATVADVMPLVNANRQLVIDGLKAINAGRCLPGLGAIMDELQTGHHLTSTDFGFKIGPVFNAASRLYDNGAMKVIHILCSPYRNEQLIQEAAELIQNNKMRKEMEKKSIDLTEPLISSRPIVVYSHAIGEGIIGLVAGRFCEKYKCPVIVFTKSEDGTLKGSGRSIPEVHLKYVLDRMNEQGLLIKYGGHAGAAGLSIEESKLEDFTMAFQRECGEIPPLTDDVFYDLDLNANSVMFIIQELDKYAPFGEGNPEPTFCLRANVNKRNIKELGHAGQHFKVWLPQIDLMGFHLLDEYKEKVSNLQEISHIICVGKLQKNWYMGQMRPQLIIDRFDIA